MRIGIDVDSGERQFEELVNGSLESSRQNPNITFFLIGKAERIRANFQDIISYPNVFLVDAKEYVEMNETPIHSLRKKRDATVLIGARMLKKNTIDVFFSAGNTGATVAASVITLGTLNGIRKPSMAAFFPRIGGGETLILDIGANPEISEETLFHNAVLGQAYYQVVWDKKEPTVGLLNMGSETDKGSTNLKKAFNYLSTIPSFVGNVEGYNALNGSVDVVVCDGFTGNSILKFAEAMKDLFSYTLKEVFSDKDKNKNRQNLLSYTFSALGVYKEKKKMITEKITPKYYGCAPLLGVNGCVLVGHGMCTKKDLINSIDLGLKLYENKFLKKISHSIKKFIKK